MKKQEIRYRVVYGIKCLSNGKMYVGSAEKYWNRYYSHVGALNSNRHGNKYLQRCWNKYGRNAFVFGVIEELSETDDIAAREQYWMNLFNVCNRSVGFNMYPIARSSKGHKLSAASKKKMSIIKKGRGWTVAQRNAMKNADRSNHNMLGKSGGGHFKSKPIIRFDTNGAKLDEWESINLCAVSIGVHKPNIVACLKGRIRQISGFTFQYKTA